MPISSGATRSLGAENETQGSYLKRYLGTLSQEKRRILENSLEAASVSGAAEENVGYPAEEDVRDSSKGLQKVKLTPERRWNSDGDAKGEQAFEQKKSSTKKSSTCTVL